MGANELLPMTDAPDTSSILLYGILAAPDEEVRRVLRGRAGVQGASLMLLPCDDLAVLASPLETPFTLQQPQMDSVLAYKEVIDAVYAAETLLPLRFGTWAHTPTEARTLVTERADACRTQLKRFEGNVEMGLRLTTKTGPKPDSTGEIPDSSSGTAYLQARKREYERMQQPLEAAHRRYREALTSLVVDATADRPDGGTCSVAFLVPGSAVDEFDRTVSELSVPGPVEEQIVGPWAPFSFASLPLN